MHMKARVFVTLKPSVFDPQGHTIVEALHRWATARVADVRQGKYFELDLDVPTAGEAEKLAAEVADRVLANPVIESFRIELAPASARPAMKFAVVVFPGSNCDHDAYHAAKHVLGQQARVRLAQGDVARRRRRRDPARRVLARRLPAHRRHRAVLAGHGGGRRRSPPPAGRCSASATASRSCSSAACCPARCCATAT